MTARQALIQLEVEGLIYRQNRLGWFVSPPRLLYDPSRNISFTDNVRSQGRVPGTRVLTKELISATSWVSRHLGIEVNAPVFLVRRIRLIDDRPVLLEHLHVDAERCPHLDDLALDRSLTDLLAVHYDIELRRDEVLMHSTALTEEQAEALGVGAAGVPGLYVGRVARDQHGNLVEFDQEFWRHDVLEIRVQVHQPGPVKVSS